MEKSYKYRIYPNKTQQELINRTFGCKRYIYNVFLSKRIEEYQKNGKDISVNELSRLLTQIKKETEWLREPDKCALQNAIRDLDCAYKRFFKEHTGFPKFKSKKDRYQSYRTNYTHNNIEYLGKYIKLPKLGMVKITDKMKPEGRILNATVSRVPSGKYYVVLCCSDIDIVKYGKSNSEIGIDVGIKNYLITSNGEKYDNPKCLAKSLKRLAFLQKALSRKTKGSANWEKTRLKVARMHEHIANQRKDYLQKLSTELIKDNDVIAIENLKVANMLKNPKLSQTIQDASWGSFYNMLEYKANWYGRTITKVGTFFPSSQRCSNCGRINHGAKDLDVRSWTCSFCGCTHDRDINAAQNILIEGERLLSA